MYELKLSHTQSYSNYPQKKPILTRFSCLTLYNPFISEIYSSNCVALHDNKCLLLAKISNKLYRGIDKCNVYYVHC
jgi:hypothetical protein